MGLPHVLHITGAPANGASNKPTRAAGTSLAPEDDTAQCIPHIVHIRQRVKASAGRCGT